MSLYHVNVIYTVRAFGESICKSAKQVKAKLLRDLGVKTDDRFPAWKRMNEDYFSKA